MPLNMRTVSAVSKGGRGNKEGSGRETARQLGLDEKEVRRACKVASLSPEAQAVAHEQRHLKRGRNMYDKARQDRLRELWRIYWAMYERRKQEYREANSIDDAEQVLLGFSCPAFPAYLNDLTCGAKTRKGTPCKRRDLYRSGRCKFHGGMSTGPVTEEGKKRCAENGTKASKKRADEADSMKGM